ncbi:hypothetical protein MPH_01367 [Macrophomina phaseolina MS6]|uniref:Uncharacterized protein n=1 Tax=Macrophomina phaseolina (strain MS6) TaxID=1126212 RepID=K2SXT0_MACPH|nr:hypothetical protein MPH_01367 [Macrophomina phaseolina MS6]
MAGNLEWPLMVVREAEEAPANITPAEVPLAGRVASMVMSLVTLCVLSICITRRVQRIHQWTALPLAAWLIIVIYTDSFLFVFVTALFKDIGLNENLQICDGAILLCLICYMTTKILIYIFLVEKAENFLHQRGRHLHHRHAEASYAASHNFRRCRQRLPHSPLPHPPAETVLLQDESELDAPHHGLPHLHRQLRHADLQRRKPDSPHGPKRRARLDLPHAMQRRQ